MIRPIDKCRWLLKCLKNSSETSVTSAPVSSLKIVGWIPTLIATFQGSPRLCSQGMILSSLKLLFYLKSTWH